MFCKALAPCCGFSTEAVSGSLQTLLKFISAKTSRQSFNSQDTFLFTKRKKAVQALKAL